MYSYNLSLFSKLLSSVDSSHRVCYLLSLAEKMYKLGLFLKIVIFRIWQMHGIMVAIFILS